MPLVECPFCETILDSRRIVCPGCGACWRCGRKRESTDERCPVCDLPYCPCCGRCPACDRVRYADVVEACECGHDGSGPAGFRNGR